MNIHIAKDGQRTIKLAKSEIQTLRRANQYLSDLCHFDPAILCLLVDDGIAGLAKIVKRLEMSPYIQLSELKEADDVNPLPT